MKIYFVLTKSRHVVPASDDDRAKLRTMKPGDMIPCRITKPRNGDHHRKFMALVQFVAEHHPKFRSVESLLIELKMRTGHYDHFVRRDGDVVYIPRSIDFEAMDEGDFAVWSAKAREILFAQFLPEFTARDRMRLAQEIDGWVRWT